MKRFALFLLLCLLVSCAPPLDVSQFHLRGESTKSVPNAMIKGEANYRYDHNLDTSDRVKKHGHYYNLKWKKKVLQNPSAPTLITFYYRQSNTGNDGKKQQAWIQPNSKRHVEFRVIGEEYLKSGRVLAWRAELSQEGQIIASEQSYLWK